MTHKCKAHHEAHDYTKHSCGHEYCPHYWQSCPRCFGSGDGNMTILAHADNALESAQREHRSHSLIGSQRTWQLQATVPGVCQAWGYAYENGQFNR